MAGINLFGFEITREKSAEVLQPAITAPTTDDGAVTVSSGGYFGTYLDLDASFKTETDLITRYREMAMQPELETAIDDIVNESIIHDEKGKSVTIILDDLDQPDNIKDMIRTEFDAILRLMDFSNNGNDIFRQWYIDGRLYYQVLIDQKQPRTGIRELVYLDPRKVKKVRILEKKREPRTGIEVITGSKEFYVYNEKATQTGQTFVSSPSDSGVKISADSVVNVNSGLMDPKKSMVMSYLHKAIKPLNQLRMIEDAIVIYRISRAPERRVFYIDVGNMPKAKADQYLKDFMTKFRNKVVYDSSTGEVRDDRKFMSMMEDFWIPRRGEGKSTEITTLPAGQNLGELADVRYFEQKLYKSLNVPVSRLEPQTGFSLGRASEITRDELKFMKFIEKLRNKFTLIFDELMERQLALKGICSVDEWNELKQKIHYDFLKDNNFAELKNAELLTARLDIMQKIDPYVGTYFSKDYIRKKVLSMNEEEIQEIVQQIEQDKADEPVMPEAAAQDSVPTETAATPQTNDINQMFKLQLAK